MKRLIPAWAVVILLSQSAQAQSSAQKTPAALTSPSKAGVPAAKIVSPPKAPTPLHLPGRSLSPITTAPEAGPHSGYAGPRVNCQLPITAIGSLQLPDAMIFVQDNKVEVRRTSSLDGHYPLLIGRVIRYDAAANETAGAKSLSGLVLFNGGMQLDALAPSSDNDLVFRSSGSLTGQVFGCDDENLLLRLRDGQLMKVALDSITYLRSPRAFIFSISGQRPHKVAGWQAQAISFQATAGKSKLGEELVAGQRKDDWGLEEDDDVPTPPVRGFSRWGPRGEDGMMFPAQILRPDNR